MLLIWQMRRQTPQERESLLKVLWVVRNGTRIQTLVRVQVCPSPMPTPDAHTGCFPDSLPVSGLQVTSFSGQEVVGGVVSGLLVEQPSMNAIKGPFEGAPKESHLDVDFFIGIPHLRGPELYSRSCYRSGRDKPQSHT